MYIYYVLIILSILLLFILLSHRINNRRIYGDLKIQQVEHPNENVLNIMLKNKKPTIFLYELELWDGFDILIGESYENIKEVLKNKKVFSKLNYYLVPFTLPLTIKWDINLYKNTKNWEELQNNPYEETTYNHLIANFSGLMMICLINPSNENLKKINNSNNIKSILMDHNKSEQLDYIIIPIRPSNLIYIPYGWYYWIYSGQHNSYCCYIDFINYTYI